MMDLSIIYEDDTVFVLNKPPFLVVNRAESVKGETVQDWVEGRIQRSFRSSGQTQFTVNSEDEQAFKDRAGIVHRIDKETSGILLIAKTSEAFIELQRQFKERMVKKTYLAVVHGRLVPETGEIRAPVGRLPWNRERFGIVPGGKEAVTKYKVLRSQFTVRGEDMCLVKLYPETGRTHQIRVHLKYVNHPIVGDYLYAGRKTSRDDRTWAQRVLLHAWKIQCVHPVSGKQLALEAPIPDDMKSIIGEFPS